MTSDATPTESLVGYDAEGIPPTHTQPAARRHTDLHDDDTRILPVLKGRTQAALESVGYVPPHLCLPPKSDLAYMAPEQVEQMLRRCNHICRTPGCGIVVDRCGQHCEDCQSWIDSQQKQNEDITHRASKAGAPAIIIVTLLLGALFIGVALLRGWFQ